MAETLTITIPTDPTVADLTAQVSALAAQVATMTKQVADMKAVLASPMVVNPFGAAFSAAFG